MKVTGVDKLVSRLNRKANVQKVVADNTNILMRKAVSRAPVDTGHLRRSITAEVSDNRGVVTSNADYSGYLENGTRYMDAQPFMKPSYNEVLPKFKQELKSVVKGGK